MSKITIHAVTLLATLLALLPPFGGAANAGLFDPPPAYPPPAYPQGYPPPNAPPGGYPDTVYSRFPQPAYDWTGFYIGINGGADWSSAAWNSQQNLATGTSARVSSPFIGGTVGYNAQTIGAWVYGAEFDFDWRRNTSIIIPPASCAPNCVLDRNWFSTARVRFGYTFDRVMPFVTAGVALSDQQIYIAGQPFGVRKDLGVGLTAGAGIEVGLWGPVSAKLEYLYVRYGQLSCADACAAGPANTGTVNPLLVTPSESIVRAGLNIRLWER